MSKTYIKYALANGGGGAPLGSEPVMMYSAHPEDPPLDDLVVRLANERFPQETSRPLYIYNVVTEELNEDQVARLHANPKHLI